MLLAVVLPLMASSCGGDDAAPPTTTAPTQQDATSSDVRLVTTAFGDVEIPTDAERIVALDEYAAMTLLSIGVTPTVVYRSLSSDVGAAVLDGLGVEVIDAPTMILDPNFEAMAAQRPDLMVMIDTGTLADSLQRYQDVAPTLVLPYERPWREGIRLAAEAFGATEVAERVIGRLEARIAEVAADAPATMSVIGSFGGDLVAISPVNPVSVLLTEIGIERPPAETDMSAVSASSSSAIPFSSETLEEHDADWVAVLGESFYDAAAVTALPTMATLDAAADDRVVVVNGEMWTGSFPFAVWWVLDDVAGLAGGAGEPATAADTSARWQDFLAGVRG